MLGQKKLPCVSNCDFAIPWWNWCRTLSFLAGGMMSASPHRTRPSLMVRVSLCCQYRQRGWGTSLMSAGQPVMMMLARALISGSLMKACWESFLAGWHYAGMMDSDIQWKVGAWPGDWIERVCLVWPFPCQGSNRLWGHIHAGIASCIGAMQACLLGSSWIGFKWLMVWFHQEGPSIDVSVELFCSKDNC